ncbi:retrovirus-related pol polyprotein from transposon TNT 1-94 [Tanacetum coccineum]
MSSNSDDIQAAGSDTRPPMLDRTDYESWSQRIRLYCRGKENGLLILQSIDQGPFELGTTRNTLGTTPEGGVLLGPERPRTYEDLSDTEKKRYDADVRATNIVLQGLPKDIYKLINHNIEAKAIWDNVKMLLAGSELTKEDRESQLYDEFELFKMLPGENINEYYDRFVTAVKLNKGLKETNHEQLYAYLKQHEKHAAQDRLIIERIAPATNDQLAFVLTVHSCSNHPLRRQNQNQNLREDECDAFDSIVDDEPMLQHIFMANLSSAGTPAAPKNMMEIAPGSGLREKFIGTGSIQQKLKRPFWCKYGLMGLMSLVILKLHRKHTWLSSRLKALALPREGPFRELLAEWRVVDVTGNRTLVEAARTMLIFSKAPLFLWAEAVATACYTQNRSLIHTIHNKTPYELVHDKKSDLSFLRIFGALCYPTNGSKDLGKMKAKADIRFFVGYAPNRKGYKIYNKRTRQIMETIHVTFNELTEQMAPVHSSSRPAPNLLKHGPISSGLVPNFAPAIPYVPPTNKDLELLFQPMFDEYFETPTGDHQMHPVPAAPTPAIPTGPSVSISFDHDAPSGSHSPSSSARQSSSVHHDVAAEHSFEVNLFAASEHEPFVNVFAPDPNSEASSFGVIRITAPKTIHQLDEHPWKWTT